MKSSTNLRAVELHLSLGILAILVSTLVTQSVVPVIGLLVLSLLTPLFIRFSTSFFLTFSALILGLAVFVAWHEKFYGSVFFRGLNSDDYYYSKIWIQGFLEGGDISISGLRSHLNNIQPNLGLLHNSIGYLYITSLLKEIEEFFGSSDAILPRILNVWFHLIVAYYSILIWGKTYRGQNSLEPFARKIIYFSVLMSPVLLVNSFFVFRDSFVGFLILLSVVLALKKSGQKIGMARYIISSGVLIVILYYLRAPIAAISFAILAAPFTQRVRFFYVYFSALTCVILWVSDAGTIFGNIIEHYRLLNLDRRSGLGYVVYSQELPLGLFARFAYLIVTPTPTLGDLVSALSSAQVLINIFIFPLYLVGLIFGRILFEVKIFSFLLLIVFLGTTSTFRHFSMFYPLVVLVAGAGFIVIADALLKRTQTLGGT